MGNLFIKSSLSERMIQVASTEYIDLFVTAMGERILLAQFLDYSNGYPE